jgi:putative transposase
MQQRDDLESACRNTIASAMRELGLKSRVLRPFKPTTTQADPCKRPAENILQQDFNVDQPNQKWVTDITYIDTDTGWVYMAAVMDCFSRKVVGWSISHSLSTELVCGALHDAIEKRRPNLHNNELLHHSDRGSQYTSDAYQKMLKTLGIACSMSRTGCCYDNAAMERLIWSVKQEWTNHHSYADLADARSSIFQYIEMFYNRKRIHQKLGYMTPEQYEAKYEKAKTVHAPEDYVA